MNDKTKLKKPLKVAFVGMSRFYQTETSFWKDILSPLYELKLNFYGKHDDFHGKPDLVIFFGFDEDYRFRWRTLPRIFHKCESWFAVDDGYYDYMFGHCGDGPKSMHLNEFLVFPSMQELILAAPPDGTTQPDTDNLVAELRAKEKTKFCNFVASDTILQSHIREAFAQQLMEYRRVDCPGKRLNNMPSFDETIPIEEGYWGGRFERKVRFQSDYKFSIAFENSSKENYISEKIFTAFAAGSIPIYWGAPNVGKKLNTRAFINCHDYKDFDAVIAHIKEVDNNDALYQSYRRESPFLPGQPVPHCIDRKAFETRLVDVIERLTSESFVCAARPALGVRDVILLVMHLPALNTPRMKKLKRPFGKVTRRLFGDVLLKMGLKKRL